jgi:hypothetical protein
MASASGAQLCRRADHPLACLDAKNERREALPLVRRIEPLRLLALACFVLLVGCIIDNDRVRVESFAADPAGTFVFAAQTNTVMTPNDDGEAEQLRRGWLAEQLAAHGMCNAGYVVETRRLVEPPDAPSGNAHDVVYSGRCL